MFKTKPSLTKAAERRLQKAAVKRVRAARAQRAMFLSKVKATSSNAEIQRIAAVLVERTCAARSADFLQQYRIPV